MWESLRTATWAHTPGMLDQALRQPSVSRLPPAIELFFRDTAGGGPSQVRVVDTDDVVVLMTANGNQFFQQVGVNNLPVGQALIDRIEVVNSSSVADVVIDDVFFVPESSAQLLQLTGVASVALLARWRSRSRRRDTH